MAVNFRDRTIADFKSRLTGGGARPNLFEVSMSFPRIATGGDVEGGSDATPETEMRYMVKAAELPASNIGDIPLNFRGRILHVAGDRTFDPWTITIINNTDWALREKFENWSQAINDRTFDSGITSPTLYQTNATVFQLARSSKAGNEQRTSTKIPVLASYKFFGLYPTTISSIPLDYGSTDTIEEFQVTFQVERWEPSYEDKWENTAK